uniref:Target of rapamycin complex subunit lst8 n=1 Tax=Parastrongyloides trichosuri TaxID=131310 RepID=A0A0N4Z9Y0_PARTI
MAGYLLFTASHDKTLRKWSFETGAEIIQIKPKDAQINSMVINSDGKILATGAYCSLKLYDTNSLDIIWSNIEAHTKNVQTVGFFKNGYEMYTGGEDGIAKIWDIRANKYSCEKAYQMPSPLNGLCLHPNQNDLIVADAQGVIYIWDLGQDVDSTVSINELDITEFFNHVQVDSTGTQVCAVSNRGKVYIINRITEDVSHSIYDNDNNRKDKMMSPLVVTTEISTISEETPVNPNDGFCIQASSYRIEHCFKAHNDYILKCKYSLGQELLATSGADGKVNIYKYKEFKNKNYNPYRRIPNSKNYANQSTTTTKEVSSSKVPDLKWIWGLEFSNDGKYLFTSGGDHTFRVWDIENEKNILKFVGHSGTVTGLAIYDSEPNSL